VRTLGLRNGAEWSKFCKSGNLPADIPADPVKVYRDLGWQSRGDWLGTDTVAAAKREFRNFDEAREFVRSHHFQTKTEYEAWARSNERPSDIPALPSRTFAKTGWLGWGVTTTMFSNLRELFPARPDKMNATVGART
jgi:hypothetical protein